jgi:aminopeptidase N
MEYNFFYKLLIIQIMLLCFQSGTTIKGAIEKHNQRYPDLWTISYYRIGLIPITAKKIPPGNEILSSIQSDTSGIDIHYLRLDIKATDTSTYIEGIANYSATITKPGLSHLTLELSVLMQIDSITINGIIALYDHQNSYLLITLPDSIATGKNINIIIAYKGTFQSTGSFSGISSHKDFNYGVPVTWTLSEPYSAKDWFPAKQVLTDKIDSVDMNITTPGYCLAGSNGNLIGITSLPDGNKCHHWKSRYPIDYYLISFAISNYQDYRIYAHPRGSTDSLLVQNYIYNLPAVLSDNKTGIDRTVKFIELFANLFGAYPFDREKYGHCLAPIGGGMEHQTMTTISGFDFGLVAHELTHMWFGDHVTCGSWQDIWLNEGFASYGEYLAHQLIEGTSSGSDWMKRAHDEALTLAGGSVYVPIGQISDENRIFSDPLSYKKGASILHMLRYEINDDSLFYNILREYGRRFAYGTATGDDFRKVVESMSGKDYRWFFDQWYYGEGYPTINLTWNQKSKVISINTEQTPSATTPVFKTSIDVQFFFNEGDTTVRIWIDEIRNHFEFTSNKQLLSVIADPNNWLLKKTNVVQLPDITDFKLYPNPFSGQLQIDFYTDSKARAFRLSDMHGRVIYQFTSADKIVYLDSSGLVQGIYLLNIIEGEKNWQLKIVKD